jgi:hypothetical protein
MHFVDMVESIEYARFDGISTKNRTGGRKIKKVAGEEFRCEDAARERRKFHLGNLSVVVRSSIQIDPHERDKMQASRASEEYEHVSLAARSRLGTVCHMIPTRHLS